MIGLPAKAMAKMFGQRKTPLNLPSANPAIILPRSSSSTSRGVFHGVRLLNPTLIIV